MNIEYMLPLAKIVFILSRLAFPETENLVVNSVNVRSYTNLVIKLIISNSEKPSSALAAISGGLSIALQ